MGTADLAEGIRKEERKNLPENPLVQRKSTARSTSPTKTQRDLSKRIEPHQTEHGDRSGRAPRDRKDGAFSLPVPYRPVRDCSRMQPGRTPVQPLDRHGVNSCVPGSHLFSCYARALRPQTDAANPSPRPCCRSPLPNAWHTLGLASPCSITIVV